MDTQKVKSSYIIISAFFEYEKQNIDVEELYKLFTSWDKHIKFNAGRYPYSDVKSFNKFVDSAYYSSYKDTMFAEHTDEQGFSKNKSSENKKSIHLTHKHLLEKVECITIKDKKEIRFDIEYADLYLFPDNTGIVSIKMVPKENDLEITNDLSFLLRSLECKISSEKIAEKTLQDLINNNLLKPIKAKGWEKYNPKYKTYTVIDFEHKLEDEFRNKILFDIGNTLPIGSTQKKDDYSPSDEYFKKQMTENKISVFNTWSALALFDTFTVLINKSDDLKHWEPENFQIYIYTLHMKFYMYVSNTKIKDVTKIGKETVKLKNDFIEFINDYYHAKISYNFLPDLIYQKLLFALGVEAEMKIMERKINRINETAEKNREIKFRNILFLIAILGIVSSIQAFSSWIVNLGIDQNIMYPSLSLGIAGTVSLAVYIMYLLTKE